MPFPGFRQIPGPDFLIKTGWGSTTYIHDSNLFLLYRREGLDVHGNTAYVQWFLLGPPTYNSLGDATGGPIIYKVGDLYSSAKLQQPDAPHLYNLQVPGMSQEDRMEDLERVVGTAMNILGAGKGPKATSRLKTALEAGLSDEDALHYVNGEKEKMSKAGKKKLEKHLETSSEGVMLDPMKPGESIEDWLKRTASDMGDGAPF